MQILAAVHMQIGKANNFLPFLLSHQSFRRVLWPPLTPPPPSKPRDPAIFMQILIFKSDCQVYSTCFKFGAHLSLISPCVNIVNQVDLLVNPLINQGVWWFLVCVALDGGPRFVFCRTWPAVMRCIGQVGEFHARGRLFGRMLCRNLVGRVRRRSAFLFILFSQNVFPPDTNAQLKVVYLSACL